jgi:hypothetical protein
MLLALDAGLKACSTLAPFSPLSSSIFVTIIFVIIVFMIIIAAMETICHTELDERRGAFCRRSMNTD